MARLLWAVLCERFLTDQETNSVSYIDAVESVTARKLPATLHSLSLCTLWNSASKQDELIVGLHVIAPSGKELLSYETPPSYFQDVSRNRVNFALGGMPIEEAGEHIVRIEQRVGDEWVTEAELPIDVSLKEPELESQDSKEDSAQ